MNIRQQSNKTKIVVTAIIVQSETTSDDNQFPGKTIFQKTHRRFDPDLFLEIQSTVPLPMEIQLRGAKGVLLGQAEFTTCPGSWQKYTASIAVNAQEGSGYLVVLAKGQRPACLG